MPAEAAQFLRHLRATAAIFFASRAHKLRRGRPDAIFRSQCEHANDCRGATLSSDGIKGGRTPQHYLAKLFNQFLNLNPRSDEWIASKCHWNY
jgi:hypothetical protein